MFRSPRRLPAGVAMLASMALAQIISPVAQAQEADILDELAAEPVPPAASLPAEPPVASSPDAADAQTGVPTIPVARPAEPQPALKEPPQRAQLEEIVVTATKREKSLRDIPASISAIDGERLESQGKLGLSSYLQEKPGVTLSEISPGLVRITLRGISTTTSPTAGTPSATGVLIGDTAFSDAYIANIQPDLSAFDLSSVEVLKGPQGTLFGGAALSGAVRYVLQDPVMGEWKLRGFTQYVAPDGGSAAFSEGVAVNIPLYADKLAVRVGYVNRKYPGVTDWTRSPRQDDVDSGEGDQLRAIVSWQPTDALNVKLTHINQDYETDNAITIADTPHKRETHRIFFPRPTNNYFTLDGLQFGYDWDFVRLISQTSQIQKKWHLFTDVTSAIAGPPPDGYPTLLGAVGITDTKSKAFSQELRLQSTDGDGFEWLVGAYYYKLDLLFDIFMDTVAHQRLFGASGMDGDIHRSSLADHSSLLAATTRPTATEKAVFFDLTRTIFDNIDLSVGARFYRTQIEGGFYGTGVLPRAQNNGQAVDYADNNIAEDGINPKFSATWHITDDISTYLSAARGFRFGGLQSVPSTPVNGIPAYYKSDTLWNYEWGWRTSWFDNTLQFDPTLFYISYKNPQIAQGTQGIPIGYTDNVGAAVSRGFELAVRWLTPVAGLSAEITGGMTDAHITVPFDDASGERIEPGTSMPGSADSQYSVSFNYAAVPGNLFALSANLGYTYIGKGYADLRHTHAINDYGTLNAGLMLSTTLGSFQPKLGINVANLLNETAVTYGETGKPLAQVNSYDTYILNPPRTITVRLAFDL